MIVASPSRCGRCAGAVAISIAEARPIAVSPGATGIPRPAVAATEARPVAITVLKAIAIPVAAALTLARLRRRWAGLHVVRGRRGHGPRLRDDGHPLDARVRMREQRRHQPLAVDGAH